MKRDFLRRLAVILLALGLLSLPAQTRAAGGEGSDGDDGPTSTIDLSFTLYMGGISLGKIELSARLEGDNYRAISSLETTGVVNAVWRSKIEASTSGGFQEGKIAPGLYDAFSLNGANPQRREMTLTYDGVDDVPDVKSNRNLPEINEELKKATLDPVSAMVLLVTSAETNREKPCTLKTPVFDGRRRYDVTASFSRTANIKMDNGLYAGPVQVCKLAYKPLAGPPQRLIENGGLPELFSWIITVPSTVDPSRSYIVPLRIWAETEVGLFTAVLTRAVVDGKPVGTSS
jgi:hypothetical protein